MKVANDDDFGDFVLNGLNNFAANSPSEYEKEVATSATRRIVELVVERVIGQLVADWLGAASC